MGVYIPNMEKPKNCRTCNFKSNKEGECWFVHDENDCPLIEIDLERDIPTVWYNRQTGQYEPKNTKQEVYERLYKMKNGERRADDRPTEHIRNDQT